MCLWWWRSSEEGGSSGNIHGIWKWKRGQREAEVIGEGKRAARIAAHPSEKI